MTVSLLDFLEPDEPSTTLPPNQCKHLVSKLNSPFTILSLNIRSLRKNFNNLLALIYTLDSPFTLIFISETCLTESEHLAFPIPGYDCISEPRNQKGGGNMLYFQNHLTCNKLTSLSAVFNSFESLFVSISINNIDYIFGNVYRPPNKSITEFNIEFPQRILRKLPNKNVMISGDFNINLLDDCNNPNVSFALNFSEKKSGTESNRTH